MSTRITPAAQNGIMKPLGCILISLETRGFLNREQKDRRTFHISFTFPFTEHKITSLY